MVGRYSSVGNTWRVCCCTVQVQGTALPILLHSLHLHGAIMIVAGKRR